MTAPTILYALDAAWGDVIDGNRPEGHWGRVKVVIRNLDEDSRDADKEIGSWRSWSKKFL